MRDRMETRGPDGRGLWIEENVALAHRRLAVLDPSDAGSQPMTTPDGRYRLLYNGELYNDAELRRELLETGEVRGGFRGDCDAETVLWAFVAWGPAAFQRLRGMFALAIYDSREHVLHLARDPLGIKPLYYHLGADEFSFASELKALLAHPKIDVLPNLPMASAYLSTLHSTLGRNTMFHGLYALQPGECARYEADSGRFHVESYYRPVGVDADTIGPLEAAERVREAVTDSVHRHLRSDVPVAVMLSGGLDSTIIAYEAREWMSEMNSWCAGGSSSLPSQDDFAFARLAAEELGARHNELHIDRERFVREWPELIQRGGLPLSTPNEIAIHAIARDMRERGFVVTLSGEGADELFGGYELALRSAANFCATPADRRSGGRFQLATSAWVAPDLKPHLLSTLAWSGCGGDELLLDHYDTLFRECEREVGDAGTALDAHLRFLRKNNLTGLLRRLDTNTMLGSIEGRTPFADVRVTELADRLPMSLKLGERGKSVLRDAWSSRLPAPILDREKKSFPLPFQSWLPEIAWRLETSPFAASFFSEHLRKEIANDASRHWQLLWPMLNLSLWGDEWFS